MYRHKSKPVITESKFKHFLNSIKIKLLLVVDKLCYLWFISLVAFFILCWMFAISGNLESVIAPCTHAVIERFLG